MSRFRVTSNSTRVGEQTPLDSQSETTVYGRELQNRSTILAKLVAVRFLFLSAVCSCQHCHWSEVDGFTEINQYWDIACPKFIWKVNHPEVDLPNCGNVTPLATANFVVFVTVIFAVLVPTVCCCVRHRDFCCVRHCDFFAVGVTVKFFVTPLWIRTTCMFELDCCYLRWLWSAGNMSIESRCLVCKTSTNTRKGHIRGTVVDTSSIF